MVQSLRRLLISTGLLAIALFASSPVHADDLMVSATVHSPPPSEPALITSHYDGQVVTNKETLIKGTCSLDTAYVELKHNGSFSGMAVCNAGSFEIALIFTLGPNTLQAFALSSTGNPGPPSSIITVTYNPPAPENPPVIPPTLLAPLTGGTGEPCESKLHVQVAPRFQEGALSQRLDWTLSLPSGCAPYRVTAEWGDGIVTIDRFKQNAFTLSHFYQQPGHYPIIFKITDSTRQQSIIQVIAVIRGNPAKTPPTPSSPAPDWVVPTLVAATVTSAIIVAGGWRWIFRPIRWLLSKLFS